MYRFHSPGDQKAIRKHRRQRKAIVEGINGRFALDIDMSLGRCRKMDGFDCGRTRCLLCNFDKIFLKRKRRRQDKSVQDEVRQWMD